MIDYSRSLGVTEWLMSSPRRSKTATPLVLDPPMTWCKTVEQATTDRSSGVANRAYSTGGAFTMGRNTR